MKNVNIYTIALMLSAFTFLAAPKASGESVVASDERIDYVGRFWLSDAFAEYEWPCTTIALRAEGQGTMTLALAGGGNRFLLSVDGTTRELSTKKKGKEFFKINLSQPGLHTIELRKLTEASYFVSPLTMTQGPARFHGLTLSAGLELLEPKAPTRTMEVFGDSNLNGFGVIKSAKDPVSTVFNLAKYESCDLGYPAKIARHFNARIHVEAWSGKGVVKDAVELGTKTKTPMPALWERVLATRAQPTWDFSRYTPELILVHLGGNDYYTKPYPKARDFQKAYERLLAKIAASYAPAEPTIITVCGKTDHHVATSCPPVEAASEAFAKTYPNIQFVQIPPRLFGPDDWGTLNHLSAEGNEKVKNLLTPIISELMGWDKQD